MLNISYSNTKFNFNTSDPNILLDNPNVNPIKVEPSDQQLRLGGGSSGPGYFLKEFEICSPLKSKLLPIYFMGL